MAKSVLAAYHQSQYVHFALNNQCGAPLTDAERATAKRLMDQRPISREILFEGAAPRESPTFPAGRKR